MWFHLRMSRILFAAKHVSQTQLDDIFHEPTIICWQLFAGHVVGSRQEKEQQFSSNDKVIFFSFQGSCN